VNPNFTEQVKQAINTEEGKEGAIIYCGMGGSLDAVERSNKGLQSRCVILSECSVCVCVCVRVDVSVNVCACACEQFRYMQSKRIQML
jgi:hypothetical protein